MPHVIPRQRKRKRRLERHTKGDGGDTNILQILPKTSAEREERRLEIADELKSQQGNGAVSAKKQKRLSNYIDTKLKREENQALIAKLSQTKIDTNLFRSSKNLGRVRDSKKDALARALKENQLGIRSEKNEALLFRKAQKKSSAYTSEPCSSSSEEETDFQLITSTVKSANIPVGFGSGLKRPFEHDREGRPIIKRRTRNLDNDQQHSFIDLAEDSEWEGFGSDMSSDRGSENITSKNFIAPRSNVSEVNADEGIISNSDTKPSSEYGRTLMDDQLSISSTDEESEKCYADRSSPDYRQERKRKASAFTAWATQRSNEAVGFVPSGPVTIDLSSLATKDPKQSFTPRPFEDDPLPPELEIPPALDGARKAFSVTIERSTEIMETRLGLPIIAEEQRIMEAVHNNDVIVICGATGSGKTTQIPQFLFEAGYGSPGSPTPGVIGITQPRRVAAVSMARRVGQEMGSAKNKVSYQIRFDSSNIRNASVKFMTDGILLREISHNFALSNYSAIVIDEVHERSINTDMLIGMMTRVVELRRKMAKTNTRVKPLKLIIMSATLEVGVIAQNDTLFRGNFPPIVNIEGRQYPVTMHFARRTERDYPEEAFKKISRGHKKLPPGGMLVFMTGQNEIISLCRKLRSKFPTGQHNTVQQPPLRIDAEEAPLEDEDFDLDTRRKEENSGESDSESALLDLGDEEEDLDFDIGEGAGESVQSIHVLPLYSQLPIQQQLRVFEAPPQGSRLIVVATNVAETSLTIPGIRYVFDCGRVKERDYNGPAGIQTYQLGWISKASAKQRAGRAGRVGPGHCYRLYSSAIFERDFAAQATPEILNTPVEGIFLTLKSMGLNNVINFPFPTPPDRGALVRAEQLLLDLGALAPDTKLITHVGKAMAAFPVSPRYARMLLIGRAQGCLDYVIALVAALAVPELVISESHIDASSLEQVKSKTEKIGSDSDDGTASHDNRAGGVEMIIDSARLKAYNKAQAVLSVHSRYNDALRLLTAICAAAHASDLEDFARTHFLRAKALSEASQLREQLTRLAKSSKSSPKSYRSYEKQNFNPKLPAPSKKVLLTLPQIAAAGFIDCVAQRADFTGLQFPHRKPKRAIHVPYVLMLQNDETGDEEYTSCNGDGDEGQHRRMVYIHPSSVLSRVSPHTLPQYLVYTHLSRTSDNRTADDAEDGVELKIPKQRIRIHPLTPITQAQLYGLAQGSSLLERWRASELAMNK